MMASALRIATIGLFSGLLFGLSIGAELAYWMAPKSVTAAIFAIAISATFAGGFLFVWLVRVALRFHFQRARRAPGGD